MRPDTHLIDIHLFETLTDQLEGAATQSGGRSRVQQWIEKNTSHPLNPHKPWSFTEHEFQLGIVNSQHPRTYVLKASQIGVSEIMVRLAMALLAKMPGRHAIYTLPDANFARKFAPSRFDPVIEASKKLQALISKELNNNEIKKFGSSYLYIAGAQKESQSISVPASMMFNDEVAYSNQEVLGTFNSRLGHLKQGEELVYGFSTPLLPGSDISRLYEEGTKDQYLCYHTACNHWVVLDPLLNVRVPKLNIPIELLEKHDVTLHRENILKAYIECPHCHQPIAMENMADPTRRAWVSEYPDRYARSFDANFLVLPAIRPPSKVLLDRSNYRSTAKWINFAIGRPADSSESRVSLEALERSFSGDYITPQKAKIATPMNTVLGMDVGKTGHLVVARKHNNRLEVLYTETPKQTEHNALALTYVEAYKAYRARMGVIDAGPEFTVTTKAQSLTRYNTTWGCYFVRTDGKSTLSFYEVKEDRGVVLVERTKALNEFVAAFNRGDISLPKEDPNRALLLLHLRNQSRVSEPNDVGEIKTWWTNTGEDRFFFALFYAWLAADMLVGEGMIVTAPQSAILMSTVRMKS